MATYSVISLLIPYHQNLFFRSWYIFSLPVIAGVCPMYLDPTVRIIH
jgi:hypothetical protein